MTLRFAPPLYPGGRQCLVCGRVLVGAVFPPAVKGDDWRWQLWIRSEMAGGHGRAKSEQAAKNALLARFRDFLRAADLVEVRDADPS